ncbi:hypothetical protein DFH27DRAFT_549732 [Peziza echinospora]|nr:hypothetical protein DFH27DRAFT_549732 [Peziza echinospora]
MGPGGGESCRSSAGLLDNGRNGEASEEGLWRFGGPSNHRLANPRSSRGGPVASLVVGRHGGRPAWLALGGHRSRAGGLAGCRPRLPCPFLLCLIAISPPLAAADLRAWVCLLACLLAGVGRGEATAPTAAEGQHGNMLGMANGLHPPLRAVVIRDSCAECAGCVRVRDAQHRAACRAAVVDKSQSLGAMAPAAPPPPPRPGQERR